MRQKRRHNHVKVVHDRGEENIGGKILPPTLKYWDWQCHNGRFQGNYTTEKCITPQLSFSSASMRGGCHDIKKLRHIMQAPTAATYPGIPPRQRTTCQLNFITLCISRRSKITVSKNEVRFLL